VHLEMTFHLRGEIALAALPPEKSPESHKPSTQLPHDYPSRHRPV